MYINLEIMVNDLKNNTENILSVTSIYVSMVDYHGFEIEKNDYQLLEEVKKLEDLRNVKITSKDKPKDDLSSITATLKQFLEKEKIENVPDFAKHNLEDLETVYTTNLILVFKDDILKVVLELLDGGMIRTYRFDKDEEPENIEDMVRLVFEDMMSGVMKMSGKMSVEDMLKGSNKHSDLLN